MEREVEHSRVSPEMIIRATTGAWAASILGAGVRFSLFSLIEEGQQTPDALSEKAGISRRGVQAILDGLLALGFLRVSDGRYSNHEDASAFLVKGKPSYMGDFVQYETSCIQDWTHLEEAARSGLSPINMDLQNNPFWEQMTLGIVPITAPVAAAAAALLEFGGWASPHVLDLGGGSGVFAAILLAGNPTAVATQVDWANVNAFAREFVRKFGVEGRFNTVDGDYHEVEIGKDVYDVVICSSIFHGESRERSKTLLSRIRGALKSGGCLVINDFVLHDDRSGPAVGLLFNSQMLLRSTAGATWCRSDYLSWLVDAGFDEDRITFAEVPAATELIIARA